jgi:AraC family transcriptional regulator
MKQKKYPWEIVQTAFGTEPIVSQWLSKDLGIYVERYICQPTRYDIEGLPITAMVTQFGGSKVKEGDKHNTQVEFFPSYSAVIPAHCPTQWQFSGFVDFSVFYFPKELTEPFCLLINELSNDKTQPISTNDPLIASCALQITQELFQTNISRNFVNRLMLVLLEKSCKIISGDNAIEIKPGYGQLPRIQNTISYIQKNLDQALSLDELARLQGLSTTHFRRLFLESTGISTHQFIAQLRLKKARDLLTNSTMPLVQLADSLGFSSQSHLTSSFKKSHAVTPARYRKLFKTNK